MPKVKVVSASPKNGVGKDWRQWGLFIAAVGCFAAGALFKLPVADESVRAWGFNIFMKVALVLMTMAIAWPQLKYLSASNYGRILLGGTLVAAMFFLIRPRAVTGILPIVVVCVLIIVVVTFLRDFFSSQRK